jgi:uncharacterized protein (TIGR00297 family)
MLWPIALLVSAVVALTGRLLRALTSAGALAATVVGSAILWRTGWAGLAALGTFFAGASLISRLAPDHAQRDFDGKGHQRDLAQVLANGGAAAIGAILLPGDSALWVVTASLAVAAADTWATAVGGWSGRSPRFILTGLVVPPGTNGGITALGTLGGVVGGLTVAVSAGLIADTPALVSFCGGIGALGMLLDSLLGAAGQARFHCPTCDEPTERPRHRCGTATRWTGGVRWISNDVVNAVATSAGALLGWVAARLAG